MHGWGLLTPGVVLATLLTTLQAVGSTAAVEALGAALAAEAFTIQTTAPS